MARVLGISTPLEYDNTIALGSNGVKLFEITRAYGAFANGGYRVEPYAVERVETSRGQVVYQAPKTKISKVIDVNTAAIMTAMLKTVIKSGTGVAANIGKPAAGKTGTTDDSRDACFIGYTPDVVTGVWVGNDDNTKNGNITGGTVPAIIWKEVMTAATAPYGASDFDYPAIDLKNYSASKQEKYDETPVSKDEKAVTTDDTMLDEEDVPLDDSNDVVTPVQVSKPVRVEKKTTLAPVPMATPSGIGE